jgi:diacylglycerol kinase (ATP)
MFCEECSFILTVPDRIFINLTITKLIPGELDKHCFNNNKTIFILNPNAGITGISRFVRLLEKYRNEVDYCTFSDIGEFRSFIKSRKENYDTFIAAGGDGTVNSLATELIDSGKILGVLPIGSGNGFAREMGFRKKICSLIKDIRKKDFFDIDVMFVNDKPSINVSGIGLDSLVAHEFHNLRYRGMFSYAVSALKVVYRIKPFDTSISLGNTLLKEKLFMVSVANTRQFGSNAFLAPMAVPDDGKFNVVIVRPFPKLLTPLIVIKLLTGKLRESKYFKYIESEEPVLITSEEKRLHIDGEAMIAEGDISVHIRKSALRVLRSSFNTNKVLKY